MKHLFILLIATLLSCAVWAQSPQSFRYQSVARDNSGNVLANQPVSFQISILSGSVSGTVEYSETHTGLTTNAFGLVEMEIGKGTPVTGTFSSINWGKDSFYVKVEMDPAGGSNYHVLSTSQLLSVPYALHSKTVETGDNWGSQTVVSDAALSGSGTTSQPLTIADNAVTSANIADGTITSVDLGSNSITSAKITDGTIVAADIASNAISTAKVANSAVTGDKIADGTITGAKIAQQSATSGQVLKWDGTTWKPASDETGIESNPFVSSGGITRNRFLTDHFVFGSTSLDDVEGSDDNKRMFFNKSKGAFRAGESSTTSWDDANVGLNSTAFGEGPVASGIVSFAAGRFAVASGIYSTALGAGTYALGMASTAFGGATKAMGETSTSFGFQTIAGAKSSVAIGQYNIGAGSGSSWVETDPVFEIGIGISDTEKANALTVLKNGNVGIGPANPSAKLEVAGQVKITGGSPGAGKVLTSDVNGLATWQIPGLQLPYSGNVSSEDVAFQVTNTGLTGIAVKGTAAATSAYNVGIFGVSNSSDGFGVYGYNAALTGMTFGIAGKVESSTGFSGFFDGGKFYVSGNVGIGNQYPAAKLEVAGQVKITGGTPGSGKVLTSDAAGLASWQTPLVGPFTSTGGITSNLPYTDHLVFGSSSMDNIAGSGDDRRMFFNKNKGAFRAGYVFDSSWDNDSVGSYSVAMGQHSKALSSNSIAMGLNVVAWADCAIALGNSAAAKGRFSTAIGTGTISTGIYSLSLGHYSEAKAYASTAIGQFNVGVGNPDFWVEADPVFEIGIGNGSAAQFRRNAVTVLKNGNVGLGPVNPAAKLEVEGQVKITGGNPGSGKVLTSDGSGLASWQTPSQGFSLPYSGSCNSADAAFAINQAGTGNGIYVYNPGTTGDIKGIEVSFNSVTGTGVAAYAHAGGGTTNGILGVTASSNGTGVKGIASHTSGDNFGVFGESKSSEGKAVWGYNTSATGIGIGICGSVTSLSGFSGFFTGGRFYVDGNVGIGTYEPTQKLHIKGNAAGNAVVFIQPNKWDAAGDYGELRFGDTNHYIRGEHTTGMTFNDANKFIFTGGNVGIGTDNPASKLDVSATQGPNIIIRDSDGGAGRPGIQFVNNYIHYIAGDDSDNEIFGFYSGYGSTRTFGARLNVHGPASGNWGKYIGLTHDGNNGRIDTDAGYLVLQPAGNRVGVGTDAPTQSLDVNGNARFRGIASDAYSGVLNRKSDGTLTTSTSDVRLKENIENLDNSLEKVMQLRGVSFTWKTNPEYGTRIGFIAQEFEKVIPELVFTNEVDGYKGINYAEVTAVLVEAIKELKAENDLLKQRLEKIEALMEYKAEK